MNKEDGGGGCGCGVVVEPVIFCEVCKNEERPLLSFYRYESEKGFFDKVKILDTNFLGIKETSFSFIPCGRRNQNTPGFGAFSISCKDCFRMLIARRIVRDFS